MMQKFYNAFCYMHVKRLCTLTCKRSTISFMRWIDLRAGNNLAGYSLTDRLATSRYVHSNYKQMCRYIHTALVYSQYIKSTRKVHRLIVNLNPNCGHFTARFSSTSKITVEDVRKEERWTKMCDCCGLHTQGDKELERYLSEELREEREIDSYSSQYKGIGLTTQLEPPDGFELISNIDSSSVVLSCRHGNEIITVRTNINDSLVDDSDLQLSDSPDESDSDQTVMLSRPRFVVELYKQGGMVSLCLACTFISTAELHSGLDTDDHEDIYHDDDMPPIEIEEFTAVFAGQKWGSKTYSIKSDRMDQRLYNCLMNMLIERGIDAAFTRDLVQFCTAFERCHYLTLLERLKNFVSCK